MEKNDDVKRTRGRTGATGATGQKGEMGPKGDPGIAGAVTVTSKEPGVVLTGTIAQAFEARILASVQKLFFTVFVLLMIMFVLLAGVGVFITRLNATVTTLQETVDNTDALVVKATSPEAAKQQEKVVVELLKAMNCADQKNLQRAIDKLVSDAPSIIEPECLKVETP